MKESDEQWVTIDLPKSITVRGSAHCKVISGNLFCEGKEFSQGETFELFAPTSHHAIELRPLATSADNVKIAFRKMEKLPIDQGLHNRLFPDMDWGNIGDVIIEGLVRSRESGFRAPEKLSELLA